MNKQELVKVALNTMDIVEKGFYVNKNDEKVQIKDLVQKSIKKTRLYSPEDSEDLLESLDKNKVYDTNFTVTNETTLQAISRVVAMEKNVAALNFASAKNPGGGFLKGSKAQEESLARASSLYHSISTKKEMYDFNKYSAKTARYSDFMIYSPDVVIFKDDFGNLLGHYRTCSFITSPAVNAKAVKRNEPHHSNSIFPDMLLRIKKILAVALDNGCETIILGAYGCGVFGNRPVDIASMFKTTLSNDFKGQFKNVIFAVYDKTPNKEVFKVFNNSFKQTRK